MSHFNKTMHLTLAAGLLVASVTIAAENGMYKGYETPPYRTLETDGAIELRKYGPHLLAEVRVEGGRQRAAGTGFRTLAGYIFGKNGESAKVAMTAPVAQVAHRGAEDSTRLWDVQFMMPSAYETDTLPTPDNPAIRFTRTDPQTQAVIRFSGFWTDRKLAEKAAELEGWMAERVLEAEGPPRYYFYDDPFTLPFNRRNEVAFVVR